MLFGLFNLAKYDLTFFFRHWCKTSWLYHSKSGKIFKFSSGWFVIFYTSYIFLKISRCKINV